MVFSLQFCQLQQLPDVCVFVCAHILLSLCLCLCVLAHASSGAYFRVGLGGVVAEEPGYCVLYQTDKPIRGTTIDINFPSFPSLPFARCFSFNGQIDCDDLWRFVDGCRVKQGEFTRAQHAEEWVGEGGLASELSGRLIPLWVLSDRNCWDNSLSFPGLSAVCSDIDNGDVSSDTAGNSKLISALFLFNLLPPPPKSRVYRICLCFLQQRTQQKMTGDLRNPYFTIYFWFQGHNCTCEMR